MDVLISLLILLLIAGLLIFIIDQFIPAPYNKPAKIVVAVIVIIYLLGYLGAGFPVWRHR